MIPWQPIIAGLIVAVAAAWLVRRMYRTIKRGLSGTSVGSCGNCPKNVHAKQNPPLVQLGRRDRTE